LPHQLGQNGKWSVSDLRSAGSRKGAAAAFSRTGGSGGREEHLVALPQRPQGAIATNPAFSQGFCISGAANSFRGQAVIPVKFNRCPGVESQVMHENEVTHILRALGRGDREVAPQLLPLVYDELRRLAAQRLRHEKPGQTLQATALVHEAYLRLVDQEGAREWNGRGHFFAAAAEAMRRILIDTARSKQRLKRGGGLKRVELEGADVAAEASLDELLVIDEAIAKLAGEDPRAAELVKLRYFAGLSLDEAAEAVGMSRSSAYEHWSYAKAWLHCEVFGNSGG
jgi:RNA polymerase sigma factor (TIGR02999 family)